jgi:hypothetical protein
MIINSPADGCIGKKKADSWDISFINLNLIVEFGRTAFEEIFNIL